MNKIDPWLIARDLAKDIHEADRTIEAVLSFPCTRESQMRLNASLARQASARNLLWKLNRYAT